jgi:hypothetical protein
LLASGDASKGEEAMDLTQKFVGTVQVRASLGEDGRVKVQLQGTSPYRVKREKAPEGEEAREVELTASITLDVTDKDVIAKVEEALKGVLALAPATLGPRLAQTIYQARAVASARGETT